MAVKHDIQPPYPHSRGDLNLRSRGAIPRVRAGRYFARNTPMFPANARPAARGGVALSIYRGRACLPAGASRSPRVCSVARFHTPSILYSEKVRAVGVASALGARRAPASRRVTRPASPFAPPRYILDRLLGIWRAGGLWAPTPAKMGRRAT